MGIQILINSICSINFSINSLLFSLYYFYIYIYIYIIVLMPRLSKRSNRYVHSTKKRVIKRRKTRRNKRKSRSRWQWGGGEY